MKKVVKFLAVFGFVIMPFLFIGCSATQQQYAIQSTMIMAESSVLKAQYTKVETLLRQVQKERSMFTESEWLQLLNVDASIDMLILKYEALTQFQSADISLSDVTFMYNLAVEGYTTGRDVIYAHWDEFQPSTQVLLNAFDTQAVQTSERLKELIANPSNQNINEALMLISGVLSIAVKMMGVAIL